MVDTERIAHFIKQYAEDHAVRLPGRVPGFKRDDIHLLPSSCPKSRVYRCYSESANAAGMCSNMEATRTDAGAN